MPFRDLGFLLLLLFLCCAHCLVDFFVSYMVARSVFLVTGAVFGALLLLHGCETMAWAVFCEGICDPGSRFATTPPHGMVPKPAFCSIPHENAEFAVFCARWVAGAVRKPGNS